MDLNGTRYPPADFTPPRAAPGACSSFSRSQLASGSGPELRRAGLRNKGRREKPCLDSLVCRCGSLLLAAFTRFDQLHIQAERLQFANQHVERLRHARLNGGLALHNGLVNLGAAKDVV